MGRVVVLMITAAAAAGALASCGGGEPHLLPGGTARDITANLETVRRLASEGDCVGASGAAQQVSEQVAALNGVDSTLKTALRRGATRLQEVVANCEPKTTETTTTATPPAEAEKPAPPKKEKKPKKGEEAAEAEQGNPALPPQAKGKAKGLDGESGGEAGGGEEGEAEAGGVGPGTPVGEGH